MPEPAVQPDAPEKLEPVVVRPVMLEADRPEALEEPELAADRRASVLGTLEHQSRRWSWRRVYLRLRRSKKLIAAIAVTAVGVLSVSAAFVVFLARSAPSWWVDIDVESPAMQDLAEQVQNGALSHLFEDRQGPVPEPVEWPVKMTGEAANAWLNVKLPEWFGKMTGGMDWPDAVESVQVVFESGTMRIGARVRTQGGSSRIYSAALDPEVRDDGSLWMRARTVSMGRLTLPASWVLSSADVESAGYLPESLRGAAETEALADKLAGRAPLFENATVRLGDGRRVRLLELRVRDGSVVALCVTE